MQHAAVNPSLQQEQYRHTDPWVDELSEDRPFLLESGCFILYVGAAR